MSYYTSRLAAIAIPEPEAKPPIVIPAGKTPIDHMADLAKAECERAEMTIPRTRVNTPKERQMLRCASIARRLAHGPLTTVEIARADEISPDKAYYALNSMRLEDRVVMSRVSLEGRMQMIWTLL